MAAASDFATVQSNAQTQLGSVMEQMNTWADVLIAKATETINLSNYSGVVPGIDPREGQAIVAAIAQNIPTLPNIDVSKLIPPDAPKLSDVEKFDVARPPEFTEVAPSIDMPDKPTQLTATAPTGVPDFHSPNKPDAPAINLPSPPTLQNVVVPPTPFIDLPAYNNPTPLFDDMMTPNNTFTYSEATYQSDLLDETKRKLLADMINGGYGIEPQDEQPLWERAREREMLAAETSIQQAINTAATRGFDIPPGAMNAIIESAQKSALEKISSVNREIALKRADMYVDNRKFTIQEARQLEDMCWKYWSFAQERALNAAKYLAEFSFQMYGAYVARFNARLAAYNAYSQEYEARVRAALANLEVYKGEIEGARLTVELQKSQVDIYTAQLQGANALVNLYQVEMEAAKIDMQIEQQKLEAFKTRVDIFTAQVGAKEAEYRAYASEIAGERSKVEMYQSLVSAYGTRVNAYGETVRALDTKTKADIAVVQSETDVYRAKIEGFRAEVESANASVRNLLELTGLDVRLFETEMSSNVKAVELSVEAQKANAQIYMDYLKMLQARILGEANVLVAHANMAAGAATSGLQTFGQIGNALASAASGIAAQVKVE